MVTSHRLGHVEYPDGLELQRQFLDARKAGLVGDTLLLLEHPPVLTLGRGAKAHHILTPAPVLAAKGIGVFDTDRGGDVTYHGPGQLVGYPILHLPPGQQDVRRYVRRIEEVLIRTLADYGLPATRIEKWPGVWLEQSRAGGPRKIAALGVHLSRWYTSHGFALNVHPDLTHFELIVPCGIREAGVTSMEAELGRRVPLPEVEERLERHFGAVFGAPVERAPPPAQTVCVTVTGGASVLLLLRAEDRGGFWQPVTGRVEPGEALPAAAARELREETGLELPVTPLGYAHGFAWGDARPPRVARETAFVARVDAQRPVTLSAEHVAFEWLGLKDALARVPFEGFKVALARSQPQASAPGSGPRLRSG